MEVKKVGNVTVLRFKRKEFTPERKPSVKRFFREVKAKVFPCRGDTITADELEKLILSTFGSDYEYHILISDEWFRVISKEKMENLLKDDDTDNLPYQATVSDCLLLDTPIIYKDPVTGMVDIAEIQELPESGGFYVLDVDVDNDPYIRDELGHIVGYKYIKEPIEFRWTRVNWVKPKTSYKSIITLTSPNGFIQTTEDHKFWIRQRWYSIGNFAKDLSNGYTTTKCNPLAVPIEHIFADNIELDPDLAWVFGLFLAEGSTVVSTSTREHAYSWHIDVSNEDILIRAKDILEQHFNLRFEVTLPPSQKKGTVRGGVEAKSDLYRLLPKNNRYGAVKDLALLFREKFYTKTGKKKVPTDVLNSTVKAKSAFLEGFLIGDGSTKIYDTPYSTVTHKYATQKSRVALLGLEIIIRKLRIPHNYHYTKKKYFELNLKEGSRKKYRKKVIYTENNTNGTLVYDLNTETHHLVASTFLVHNCDDFSDVLLGCLTKKTWNQGYALGQLWYINEAKGFGHAVNLFVDEQPKIWVVEPQNDGIYEWGEGDYSGKAYMVKI